MKKLLAGLVALALCACGSEMDEAESTIDRVAPVDLFSGPDLVAEESTVDYVHELSAEELEAMYEGPVPLPGLPPEGAEQAFEKRTYVIPPGFGIAGTGVRCGSVGTPGGFVGGECKIPKEEKLCIKTIANTETPPAGFFTTAMTAGVNRCVTQAITLGWAAEANSPTCLIVPNTTINFKNLGTGIMGKHTPNVSSGDIFTVPAGTVKPWTSSVVGIDPSSIANDMAGFSSHSTAEKEQFVENIVFHELCGHTLGLGHNNIIDTLMEPAPIQPPLISSFYSGDRTPTGAELGLVITYSSTP